MLLNALINFLGKANIRIKLPRGNNNVLSGSSEFANLWKIEGDCHYGWKLAPTSSLAVSLLRSILFSLSVLLPRSSPFVSLPLYGR